MTELVHDLTPHFPVLSRHHSTRSLEDSAIYKELRPRIERVLASLESRVSEDVPPPKGSYRAVAWNIERGSHFKGIVETLKNHPRISGADFYFITEVDLGMARSGNRHIASELAGELGLNYFFAPSYLNLSKGSGHEAEYAGENRLGIHGNAILSRYPLFNLRTVPLPNGKDKMRGNEKRIGAQRALIADTHLGNKTVTLVCVHLDAHSSQKHRALQMRTALRSLESVNPGQPILLGGDWNTSTYNSSRALHAIVGFWIRVFMGVGRTIRNHYLHPYRFWERELFGMLEARGFNYEDWNEADAGTIIYDIKDIQQYKNLREWVPGWCFRFVEWSLREHNGVCPLKLDWFAGKNLVPFEPKVTERPTFDGIRTSDHAAIVINFKLPP